MRKQNEEITVKNLLDIFLPKLWLILIVSVVAAVIVGGYSKFFKKDTYTSYVSFMVVADTTSIPTSGGYDGVQSLVSDYIHLLSSRTFCELVAEEIRGDHPSVSASQVKSAISMKQLDGTNFIYAYATSETPEFSKSVADAISRLSSDYVSKSCDYKVKISPVDQPLLAESPDGKNVLRNSVIGFAAGMIVSMLVVFILSRFDVVIRSKDVIERTYEIPVLGVIPRYDGDGETSDDDTVPEFIYAQKNIQPEEKVKIQANRHPNVVDGRVVFDKTKK